MSHLPKVKGTQLVNGGTKVGSQNWLTLMSYRLHARLRLKDSKDIYQMLLFRELNSFVNHNTYCFSQDVFSRKPRSQGLSTEVRGEAATALVHW